MTTENVIQQVVERDRQLEKQAEGAALALMEHRWHWTLDESNPDRMGLREYARLVGRDPRTIGACAHGYILLQGVAGSGLTTDEAKERARMGAEEEMATEAVAESHGVSFGTARKTMAPDIQRVRDYARSQQEEGKSTYQEAAPRYANLLRDTEKAEKRNREERRQRIGLRYAELDGRLLAARRDLVDALRVASDVEWGDEERELLLDTLRNVEKLLKLIDQAITGTASASLDWEAEINNILSGGAKA